MKSVDTFDSVKHRSVSTLSRVERVDLTQPVMEKIVRFEKRRSKIWLIRFTAIVAVLLLVGAVLAVRAAQRIWERQSLELLTLFAEDREIIAQYWQDTLGIFWEELPQRSLTLLALALILLLLIIFFTRKKRQVVKKRMHVLVKRERIGKD